ncbi:MAG: RNA pseudouridine synthase [Opitutaceae bacterium]|nr:RNA pseudouridine synthase [Opitutaceae bacterium]|tara:strand:+ start:1307 stop:2122 length:816 start_codon:yes stop_codon:yes gene_type:complete
MSLVEGVKYGRYGKACAWPPRPPPDPATVRQITPDELRSWILYEDDDLFVLNKPGDVVCHPSKAGPWSSLVGAVREYTGLPTVHLIFRLDRETSGVVVFAKHAAMASRLQKALQKRWIGKTYTAILTGEMQEAVTVNQPLGDDLASPVYVKTTVSKEGSEAISHFTPIAVSQGFTLAKVLTETGRKHQIRAHAQWMGRMMVGDKIYGPDERLYLDFIDHGWSDALAEKLLLKRQALHCAEIDLTGAWVDKVFKAPLTEDLATFSRNHGLLP